jgi:aryl-alcohol dehydrogenase-like predicted oxidoreductase
MTLALGAAQFGLDYGIANPDGKVSRSNVDAILALSKIHGIDTIDTAKSYGDSEECLGNIGTKGFKLITKLPTVPKGGIDIGAWVSAQVSDSLEKLQIAQLDGVLLHNPSDLLSSTGKELYAQLCRLKNEGLAKKIGVSIYSPNELILLLKNYRFDIVQAPFNLIDRRLSTSGWLKRLHDAGVEIHTRSAFLQGLLLVTLAEVPDQFNRWGLIWKRWHRWLIEQDRSAVAACLGFAFSFKEIDRIIVGVQSCQQLSEIIQGAQVVQSFDWPNIGCNDELLINPSLWARR